MLLAPREVCASAVRTADPANSNAIARVSVTLRIRSLLRVVGMCPAVVPNGGIVPGLPFWSTAENRRCAWAPSLAINLPCRVEPWDAKQSLTTPLRFDPGQSAHRRCTATLTTNSDRGRIWRPKERSPGRGRSEALVQKRHHDSG